LSGDYAPFAARLAAGGLVTDPWIDGQPRFDAGLLTLPAAEHLALVEAAEAVAAVHDELAAIVAADPELLGGFFGLTETQRLMWALSAPFWHGVARADVFQTADGPRCCELNCDTPSGHPEAIALSAAAGLAGDAARDPNHRLERAFAGVVAAFARRVRPAGDAPVVGIIYPTEMTEDLALVSLYRRWLEARGAQVVLGSPFNLAEGRDGRVTVLGTPCDVLVRHYKTDWWSEREPVWLDEAPLPDPEPLVGPLRAVARATLAGRVAVVNPFGAVLPQNKRALAFCWEHRDRFSAAARRAIGRYIPWTERLEVADQAALLAQREAWVLKSDYGCEGEEVLVGAETSAETWREALRAARPGRWIVQRRFEALRDPDGQGVNFGVFLAAGRAAGLYARRSRLATDRTAVSLPVALEPAP
jgi:hypothetical protein